MKRLTKRQLCAVAHSIAHGTIIAWPNRHRSSGTYDVDECRALVRLGLLRENWTGGSGEVAFGDTPAGRAHIAAACVVQRKERG